MERSDSQSTSCSDASCFTTDSSSSSLSLATDYSSLDPELTKYGAFLETSSQPGLSSPHEPFAVDATLAAAGSHFPQGGEELPQTLHLADRSPQFSTNASREGAAWHATLVAQNWISNQWSFGEQGPPYISAQAVSEALGRHHEQRELDPTRLAVQDVLSQQLADHFNSSAAPSYAVTENILEQAAYQLQTLLEGPEVVHICYYAIVATLTELFKPAIDLENHRSDGQCSSDSSAPVPAPADNKERFRCPHHGCDKGASRQADLERHIRIVHLADAEKPKFQCDYKVCSRHANPFLRQDHFRDHLRVYHNEDILRRGNREDEVWWSTRARRALHSGWWRCSRCLVRVVQRDNGWVCPGCGNRCEKERQEHRSRAQPPPNGDSSRRERGMGKRSG
ncbi:hypothetical protein C8A05DRAFT_40478 [Staphylotrichum tortipilum]|uniref:C2H2-type domain-containing protein n=1 Tax=Staphylotrichum tortipilum TaxID=2831512 RepID=A0AAN6RY43_9PEZI|nr:hypothetical protein C8A05DRAFT_40478 [Staphylotrichum longicolle]